MDINKSDNNHLIKATLPISIRAILIALSVSMVIVGLIVSERNLPNTPQTRVHTLHMPAAQSAEQSNDTQIAVIEETPSPPVWHIKTLPSSYSLARLLKTNGIRQDDINAILALSEVKASSKALKNGQSVQLLTDDQNKLYGLRYQYGITKTLNVTRDDDQFIAHIVTQPITNKNIIVHGNITGSLQHSAQEAGVPHKIILQLANIMTWKINFSKDLHLGDSFTLIYNEEYVGNKKIETGNILAANVHLQERDYEFVEYSDTNGNIGYYSPTGYSLKTGFLRTPLHYTRISSPFSLSRVQPILHFSRPHLGVDLAAPRGTPIDAAGDGIITFVGRETGYGNLIILDHGHGITTRYGHIQRFAKGMLRGLHVKEGQIIAYVGSTGLATGPHLHYEFRINGIAHDPLRVKLPGGQPIAAKDKLSFLAQAKRLLRAIDNEEART